jgi:hypothetical protein
MVLRRAVLMFSSIVTLSVCSFGCGDDDDDGNSMNNNGAGASDSAVARDSGTAGATGDAGTMRDAATNPMRDGSTNTLIDAALDSATTTAPDGAVLTPAADYTKAENWLCRPDRATDACDTNLDTTIVKADGTTELEKFTAATNPEVDCFYVYPTVSLDTTDNSDLVPGMEEEAVIRSQFARFGSKCRLFAPMYRQVTLTALRASIAGTPINPDRSLGYRDVLASWQWYLKNENKGRGVVLVGHSQGSGVLLQLIREQIDPDPSKTPLIAALLIGTNITVPQGKAVGGSFQKVPLCTANDQLGCVVSLVSFRSTNPPPAPPAMTRFGRTAMPGQVVGCTNPAALAGGPAELRAYLGTMGAGASGTPMGAWVTTPNAPAITTPFVSVPGLLTGECKSDANGSYLSVTVNGNPADPRTDTIVGDVVTMGAIQADWGLHLIDVSVVMGDLLNLVETKAKVFLKR